MKVNIQSRIVSSLQQLDGTELQGRGCTGGAGGTFYGGPRGTQPASGFALMVLCCFLMPPPPSSQGFLYVFGGMLDSAYSTSRYPLWVFDLGEPPRLLQLENRRAAARLRVTNMQRRSSTKLPPLAQWAKTLKREKVFIRGLKEEHGDYTQTSTRGSFSPVCMKRLSAALCPPPPALTPPHVCSCNF